MWWFVEYICFVLFLNSIAIVLPLICLFIYSTYTTYDTAYGWLHCKLPHCKLPHCYLAAAPHMHVTLSLYKLL